MKKQPKRKEGSLNEKERKKERKKCVKVLKTPMYEKWEIGRRTDEK